MAEPPPGQPSPEEATLQVQRERWELLSQIDEVTERPLVVLSFVWLVLLVLDFTVGVSGWLQTLTYVIWGLFILDFILDFVIAPRKLVFLRGNMLTMLSLMLPALRIFRAFKALRILRATRAARSVSFVRLLTTVNRGIKAVRTSFGRRGFGYVLALTLVITLAGAAGLNFFEGSPAPEGDTRAGFDSYGDALWWTAMIMTTIGSEFVPLTAEGRVLTFILSLYGLAIFGYVTAAIASLFIAHDAEADKQENPLAGRDNGKAADVQSELTALRQELAELRQLLRSDRNGPGRQEVDGV